MSRLTLLLPPFHLILMAASALLPPTNLQIISKNFQHILKWEDHNNESLAYYNVNYKGEQNWTSVFECSNITTQNCDLTEYFPQIFSNYIAGVQIFTLNDASERSYSKELNPVSDTLLGPPVVNIFPGSNNITLNIQPPISHLKSPDSRILSFFDDNVYNSLNYNIVLWQPKEKPWPIQNLTKLVHQDNYTKVLSNLLPNTNYCISVSAFASLNTNGIPSALKCVTTKPIHADNNQAAYQPVLIVCGVLLVIGIFCFLIGLDRAGYICMSSHFFPRVLKSLPKSNSTFDGNKDFYCEALVVSVETTNNSEKDNNNESDDEYCGKGYATRKTLVGISQSKTSGENGSSALLPSENSSSGESSGQDSGTSAEASIHKEPQPVLDINECISSNASLPKKEPSTSSNPSFISSGAFNINLNSVSVGNPEPLWTDIKNVSPKEEQKTSAGELRTESPLGAHHPELFTNVLLMEASTVAVPDGCSSEEAATSEDSDASDLDEHFPSNYMSRLTV